MAGHNRPYIRKGTASFLCGERHLPCKYPLRGEVFGQYDRTENALIQNHNHRRAGGMHQPPWGMPSAEPIGSLNFLSLACSTPPPQMRLGMCSPWPPLRLAKSRLRRLLPCTAPAGASDEGAGFCETKDWGRELFLFLSLRLRLRRIHRLRAARSRL